MKYPQRKHPRLKSYDYSQDGYYYITICTDKKQCILGHVGMSGVKNIPTIYLSETGTITKKYVERINSVYPHVRVDQYVIMPNHIHLILALESSDTDGGLRAGRPTVQTVVRSVKSMVSREIGKPIWQDSFYDTVIRNRNHYEEICRYIHGNPGKWLAMASDVRKGKL